MPGAKPFKLNLKGAPLIVSLAGLNAGSELELKWPETMVFAELNLPAKAQGPVQEQLGWIKRQYEVLSKSPKARSYAPHVMPYLAQLELHLDGPAAPFGAAVEALGPMPLPYIRNLDKSLRQTFGPASRPTAAPPPPSEPDGPLVQDRVRFRLIDAQPLNELEAGLPGYYGRLGLSWAEAFDAWLDLPYDQKEGLLQGAVAGGSADVSYRLEAVLEPQLLMDGASLGLFKIVAVQAPTPAHGYSLPRNLGDGGMLERCFDISYELYGRLQRLSPAAAPLACLWGHRLRAVITIDSANLRNHAVRLPSRLRKLVAVLQAKLAEKHPTIIKDFGATGK